MNSNTETYEQILQMFTHKETPVGREWMATPFVVGSKAVSTNGHTLVAVPKWAGEYADESARTKGVYPAEANCHTELSLEEIKVALSRVPLVDEFTETDNTQGCKECGGDGSVEWVYSTYTKDDDCPACDGAGYTGVVVRKPTGRQVLNDTSLIRIGVCYFAAPKLLELVDVADLMNTEYLHLVLQTDYNRATLFLIGDVEVLIMPVYNDDPLDPDVVAEINMKPTTQPATP